jgi:hypothetical protein
VWHAIRMGNATDTGQNGIIKQLMHIKRVGRLLPHAGRCLNPVGEAAPKRWGHQCASRRAPSSGLTTTSRALVGQRRWIIGLLATYLKTESARVWQALSPVHVAPGPLSGVTTASRALGRTASPTVGVPSGLQALCLLLRLLGAPSQPGPWRG